VDTGSDVEVETVAELIHGGDSWLNSCAADAIGSLGLKSLDRDLDAWQKDPDPLLSETVRQAKLRLAKS
jgi:hypothetical protein